MAAKAIGWCKGWVRRHPVLFVLVLLAAIPMFRGTMNLTGFCWAEGRWLSDEERIDAAIENALLRTSTQTAIEKDNMVTYGIADIVDPYKDREELKRKNPDCCVVGMKETGDGAPTPYVPLDAIIWGERNANTVYLSYKEKYHDASGKVHVHMVRGHYFMTNCGEITTPY